MKKFRPLKSGLSGRASVNIYVDHAQQPELETEMFIDAEYRHLPLRDYVNMAGVMHSVVRDYDKIGKRNRKKDDNHLNKHAMHLLRLFMMAIAMAFCSLRSCASAYPPNDRIARFDRNRLL